MNFSILTPPLLWAVKIWLPWSRHCVWILTLAQPFYMDPLTNGEGVSTSKFPRSAPLSLLGPTGEDTCFQARRGWLKK